jgi:hypothetical protein
VEPLGASGTRWKAMLTILALLLAGHGLITTMIGVTGLASPNAPAMTLPGWFEWWPGPFGRSWLFDTLNLGPGASLVGAVVWLCAGVALVGAGLGLLGFGPLHDQWQLLGLVGATSGLVALAVYFHPLYLAAVVINVVVVAAIWRQVVPSA